jgi:hypothetical protein
MNAPGCCALLLICATSLLAGCGGSSPSSTSTAAKSSTTSSSTSSSSTQIGFEGMPIEPGPALASISSETGRVDGVDCASKEQLAYHIHAHLTVYVNGSPRAVPGGVGIPGSVSENSNFGPVSVGGSCLYWLHTHAPDGVIHVESPFLRLYTLGNFFDVWRQPLSARQAASATGTVTALVNGKPWKKSVRDIPLLPRSVIQLDVGSPVVPFQKVSWTGTRL